MPNGDLSDFNMITPVNTCTFTNCGNGGSGKLSCAQIRRLPGDTQLSYQNNKKGPNTFYTIKDVYDNYKQCSVNIDATSDETADWLNENISFAYADLMNILQDTANRRSTDLNTVIDTQRKQMDAQLKDVYGVKGGVLDEYKRHYEASLMSGLLWGTLAATVAYMIFIRK
jgi:hypothetical protein